MRVFDYIGRHSATVMGAAIIVLAFCLVLFWKENRKQSEITSNSERTVAHKPAVSPDISRTEIATKATVLPGSTKEVTIQKELLRREEDEKQKKEWMKSIGMENEGTKPVDAELRAIAGTLAQYYQAYREYPQGDGKEVAASLLGRVPGRKAFLEWNKKRISPNGEFLDPWGIPYFIKVSGEKIELRSAGPNHIFWDADDQVVK